MPSHETRDQIPHAVTVTDSIRRRSCPVCRADAEAQIFSKRHVPKYNLERHWTRDSALQAPRGELDFRFCATCQCAFNAAFEQADMDYAVDYEASRAHSTVFTAYLDRLCEEVNDVMRVAGKRVVEVGCGDGQFLLTLRQKYRFTGYGFDPSVSADSLDSPFEDVQFIRGYYTAGTLASPPDVVILRHILEHQGDPHAFLSQILSKPQTPTRVYIEVPAWEWIIEHVQIQAFSYEHCSYYSRFAIQQALEPYGLFLEKIAFGFGDEYLQYYGSSGAPRRDQREDSDDRDALIQKTGAFGQKVTRVVGAVKDELRRRYPQAVLWGAAGKGTTFLNVLDLGYRELEYVVDSNPRRHDTFIPGTGQRVVSPEFLKQVKPDCVLLTNPLYAAEIGSQLNALGLRPELVPIDTLIRRVADTSDAEAVV